MAKISKEKRSKIMASIHSKNTKPEIIVRHYLWKNGFRYRLNYNRLPGHPDIVLRKYRTCIFVNGCFWHGHNCPNFRPPKTNKEFWETKIQHNRERDKEEQRQLRDMGWHVITICECQLKKDVIEHTLKSLAFTLNHIFLTDKSIKNYREMIGNINKHIDIAAEP